MMPPGVIAICSSPECTRHAAAQAAGDLPRACPTCGAPLLAACWKCAAPITDPFTAYCAACGVPLKRVLPLPRRAQAARLVAICSDPECDWAVAVLEAAALPTRCPACGAALAGDCWKCGSRVTETDQHYCGVCGVPLKRRRQPA